MNNASDADVVTDVIYKKVTKVKCMQFRGRSRSSGRAVNERLLIVPRMGCSASLFVWSTSHRGILRVVCRSVQRTGNFAIV